MNLNVRFSFLLTLSFIIYSHQQAKDPDFIEKFKDIKTKCAKEEGVDAAEISRLWRENHYPADDPKVKCYFKCMLLAIGVMDESGDVVDEKLAYAIAQLQDQRQVAEVVEECGPLKGADLCQTAFQLMTCINSAQLD